MTKPETILKECVPLGQWGPYIGKCVATGYNMRDAGLPTFELNGREYVHVPTANEWMLSRIKSRRKRGRAA